MDRNENQTGNQPIQLVEAWVVRTPRGERVPYHLPCGWFCPPGHIGQVKLARADEICGYCERPLGEWSPKKRSDS